MLKALTIENYALIDALDINFDKGFSIITGETGAGKSILLGALSLITGQRAEVSVLKDPEQKCVVEGVFDLSKYKLQAFFEQEDIDYEDETTIRRIINPNGKSRAFVNDVPVTVQQLKSLSPKLIDIHSQHQNLLLQDGEFQMLVVDTLADHGKQLSKYSQAFSDYRKAVNDLKKLQERAEETKEELDYIKHQFEELESGEIRAEEPKELEQELEALTHAEDIKSNLVLATDKLSNEEFSILSSLQETLNSLRNIEDYYPKAKAFAERVENSYYDLKDIAEETENLSESVEHNPDRIEEINQRLALYFQLQQKHRAASVAELIEIREKYRSQLVEIENFDDELKRLGQIAKSAEENAGKHADKISKNRAKVIPSLEKNIKKQLNQLGMPSSYLKIEQTTSEKFLPSGKDIIRFLFTANKQGNLQEIAKVASGGEISRVMLTLKALLSQKQALPTIIFDEIDTGVSGDIADKMAEIMRSMGMNMQVISITHLPQVAAKGSTHYKVYKKDTKTGTQSNIKKLSNKERTEEIAKMLSGSQLTDAALKNAEELIRQSSIQGSLFD